MPPALPEVVDSISAEGSWSLLLRNSLRKWLWLRDLICWHLRLLQFLMQFLVNLPRDSGLRLTSAATVQRHNARSFLSLPQGRVALLGFAHRTIRASRSHLSTRPWPGKSFPTTP